jgi:hypothetical protein
MLLLILVPGLIGMALELLLLAHDETLIQLVPLVLIGLGLTTTAWHVLAESSTSLRALRVTMIAFIASGALGVALHYRGSVEFQKEVDPSIQGFALFMKAMHSKAPPALAPAAMTWFGLLGLACTYLVPYRGEKI